MLKTNSERTGLTKVNEGQEKKKEYHAIGKGYCTFFSDLRVFFFFLIVLSGPSFFFHLFALPLLLCSKKVNKTINNPLPNPNPPLPCPASSSMIQFFFSIRQAILARKWAKNLKSFTQWYALNGEGEGRIFEGNESTVEKDVEGLKKNKIIGSQISMCTGRKKAKHANGCGC